MAAYQRSKSSRLANNLPDEKHLNPALLSTKGGALDDFDAFFEVYWPRILGVLDRLVGDPDEAEDLALEAFLKLYQAKDRLGSEDNPGGWLYRVAMNLGLNALRGRYRRKWYEILSGRSALESAAPLSPPAAAESAEERRQVQHVLAELQPRSSQLLVLRSAGLSYQELAETLQVGLSSVGSLLNRAEKEFEKRYRSLYGKLE
ncbi:MAG TPA: sigma-70 family RNA polymerase sigma factor [Anaerolineaceae bacterium]|jgi:RNA polymerase sigma-70 factor (ECF subfamily)